MSRNAWIIFIVVVVGLLGGLVLYSRASNPAIDVTTINTNQVQKATDQNGNVADHTFGTSDGKVTLIEYGDFQCPYCGQAYPQVRPIMDEYGDVVTIIFRNFPITTAHPNAKAAAAAAEAVGLQSSELYWKMNDSLYQNQSQWQDLTGSQRASQFALYAKTIGADMKKYDAALANGAPRVNQKINFDLALAKKINVTSTPTFYLNGKEVESDIVSDLQRGTGDKLRDALDAAIKKAGLTIPERTTK